MKTSITTAVAIISLTIVGVVFAQGGMGMGMGPQGGMGMMSGSSVRHHFVMQNGIDPEYAGATNPLSGTAESVAHGRQIYEQNCATCHGPQGFGDGPAGKSLQPPPANLVNLSRMPMVSDGYLYWTVAEGGVPVGSSMPPFKDVLKSDDIWAVILYLQTL
ncbi:MAG: cytochrome c [Steroidobacteraceae bacterium]|nr:cytochrome c [Steroidobacteraceae bacterium]